MAEAQNDLASREAESFFWFDNTPFDCAKNQSEHSGGLFRDVYGEEEGEKKWAAFKTKYDAKLKVLLENIIRAPTIFVGTGVPGTKHAADLREQFVADPNCRLDTLLIDPFHGRKGEYLYHAQ